MTSLSPIALFAFNRPEHTRETLAALSRNECASESELTIFCDGPRSADDEEGVAAVREIARNAQGFRSVRVVERPENLGLARSVITGVSSMLEESETIIVLEDDLVTSPFFLKFMNDALETYADDDRVISVCGYSYPVRGALPETFFLTGAHCWGWGTWRRGWALFEHDPIPLLEQLEENDDLLYEFDRAGSYPQARFLLRAAFGQGDSWALRWMASATVKDKLTLYPGQSLVTNIGMDSTGTNAPELDVYAATVAEDPPMVGNIDVRQHAHARKLMRDFHVRWRSSWRPKHRLYYLLTKLLPERIERKLYASKARKALAEIRKRKQMSAGATDVPGGVDESA